MIRRSWWATGESRDLYPNLAGHGKDESSILQAAIDEANAKAARQVVRVPQGVFRVNATVKPFVRLVGAGASATVLKSNRGASSPVLGSIKRTTVRLGTVSSGSNIITNMNSTTGLVQGQQVVAAGVPNNATISTVTANSITFSGAAATGTNTNTIITVYQSSALDPHHNEFQDFAIDCDYQNVRGLELVGGLVQLDSNGRLLTMPLSGGSSSSAYNGSPEVVNWPGDAYPHIENVQVFHSKADAGVVIGTGDSTTGEGYIERLFVYGCSNGRGLVLLGPDCRLHALELGNNAAGMLLVASSIHITNSKFWYSTAATGGDGSGLTIQAGIVALTGCETQDNSLYGVHVLNTASVRMDSHTAGGDQTAGVCIDGSHDCRVDVMQVWADRWQSQATILLNGTCTNNEIVVRDNLPGFTAIASGGTWSTGTDRGTGWAPIKYTNGATASKNYIRGYADRAVISPVSIGSGTYTPDMKQGGFNQLTLTGNITIGPATDPLPGQEIAFIITQDSTGSRAITWDASYTNPPAINLKANSVSVVRFFNNALTGATANWVPIGPTATYGLVVAPAAAINGVFIGDVGWGGSGLVGISGTGQATATGYSLLLGGTTTYLNAASGGTVNTRINNTDVAIVQGTSPNATVYSQAAAHVPLAVQGAASQTGDLLQCRNSSGTPLTKVDSGGNLRVMAAGKGLCVAEGSNAKQGTATLTTGAVTVSNTAVTASSRIMLTAQDNNTTGALRISARTAGTSFTVTSSVGTDSGVVAYEIFEPA